MNGKQVIAALGKQGFKTLGIRGSHHIMGDGKRRVTVPVHGAFDLKPGTLKSIEKQAGVRLT